MDYPTQTSSSFTPPQTSLRKSFDGDDPNWAVAATQRHSQSVEPLEETKKAQNDWTSRGFVPLVPTSFHDAGLSESQVEALVLKFLLNVGGATGREIAQQVALPFGILESLLHGLKSEQLVLFKSGTPLGDYYYRLTDTGADRARRYAQQSTYFGAAPVTLGVHTESIIAQSVSHVRPSFDSIKRAFADLVLPEAVLQRLGEAIHMGLGVFIHGDPGNGKTSIAERITSSFGQGLWMPRAISVGGEVIRLFDPNHHQQIELDPAEDSPFESPYDRRWVFVRRPTLVVGGELELGHLDIATNAMTRISEAPLQLKANGGTLVFDDFGRNRFAPEELLNRLIVPLEKRVDHLHMPSGRTFQVPFDPMVVFSTNLEPSSLVDEAFLRRIPFTIRVTDPTESEFRTVFKAVSQDFGLACEDSAIDYLLQRHYRDAKRARRFCHARDLLRQVRNSCEFTKSKMVVTEELLDRSVANCMDLRSDVVGRETAVRD